MPFDWVFSLSVVLQTCMSAYMKDPESMIFFFWWLSHKLAIPFTICTSPIKDHEFLQGFTLQNVCNSVGVCKNYMKFLRGRFYRMHIK